MSVTSQSSQDVVPDERPSAVATFHNLISRLNSKHISSDHNSLVATLGDYTTSERRWSCPGPNDLPTEILLLIFQHAFNPCVDWQKTVTLPPHYTVWLEDDPLSPFLFPYSLASVCRRWSHVLSSVPAYWTRVVIMVDSQTPSTVIGTLLQWAGDLPLHFTITRHRGSSAGTDRGEYARVRDALDLLRPHIRHTWSLIFNVKYSSSLPAIWREQGDAHCLRVLTLMSSPSETASIADLPRLPQPRPTRRRYPYNTPLDVRSLEEVTLGGHFLNDALMFGKQRNHWFCTITSLTISGYVTSHGDAISLYSFISMAQTCTSLQKMTIENVVFVNDVHPSYRFRLEAPVVCLRKVTDGGALGTIISQTLGSRLKEIVSVAECPFDNFGTRNLFRTSLPSTCFILDSMDASCFALEKLACFWNGENLSVVNCPGLSDLFMQSVRMDETPPRLCRLQIVDCENISAAGVISLVRLREIQSQIDEIVLIEGAAEPRMPLIELQVRGRGPSIELEQAQWLAEHVDSFSWNTIANDGMWYTWDASTRGLVASPTNA